MLESERILWEVLMMRRGESRSTRLATQPLTVLEPAHSMRGSCAGSGPLEFGVPITPLPRTMKLGDWKHEPDGTFVVQQMQHRAIANSGLGWECLGTGRSIAPGVAH